MTGNNQALCYFEYFEYVSILGEKSLARFLNEKLRPIFCVKTCLKKDYLNLTCLKL